MKHLRSDRENTGNLKIQFEWGSWFTRNVISLTFIYRFKVVDGIIADTFCPLWSFKPSWYYVSVYILWLPKCRQKYVACSNLLTENSCSRCDVLPLTAKHMHCLFLICVHNNSIIVHCSVRVHVNHCVTSLCRKTTNCAHYDLYTLHMRTFIYCHYTFLLFLPGLRDEDRTTPTSTPLGLWGFLLVYFLLDFFLSFFSFFFFFHDSSVPISL